MDWKELHTSDLWQGFLSSKEVRERVEALERFLLYGTFDNECQRGIIQGQMRVWKALPGFVESLAKHQEAQEEKQEKARNVTRLSAVRERLQRIW